MKKKIRWEGDGGQFVELLLVACLGGLSGISEKGPISSGSFDTELLLFRQP